MEDLPDIGDEAFAMAMRIEEEVADVPDVSPRDLPFVTDGEIRDAMARGRDLFARALQAAPGAGIEPKQLRLASGMSRSWVMGQLSELVRNGAVQKVQTGLYRPVPGMVVADAMEEIREAGRKLLAEAQSA